MSVNRLLKKRQQQAQVLNEQNIPQGTGGPQFISQPIKITKEESKL